jgi:5-methylcytosine-specific restriction enzyme subunit McrC
METTRADRSSGVREFDEETDFYVSPDWLGEEAALRLHRTFSKQIEVQFPTPVNGHQYVLRSRGLVGQIPLDEDHLLVIHPKTPVSNIFRMLEYAYKLRSFEFLSGIVLTESLDDLYERLVMLLATSVLDRARKGLYREYVQREDQLPYLRGRIRLGPSIAKARTGAPKLVCEFEELTADVSDNRILAWTLYRLTRTTLRRIEVRHAIRKAYRVLAGSISITPAHPRDCIQRTYHRLNEDYRPLHALCRFFLENMGPGIKSGTHEMIPFTVNMPMLFQSFVYHWLKDNLSTKYDVESQARIYLDNNRAFYFDIDLLLRDRRTGTALAVLDTKYKRGESPSSSDISQIVAYAVSEGTNTGILVYPSMTPSSELKIGGSVTVKTLCFDLSQDLETAGKAFIHELAELTGLDRG